MLGFCWDIFLMVCQKSFEESGYFLVFWKCVEPLKKVKFFFHYFSLSGAIYEIEKEFLTQLSPMLCFPTMDFERRQLHCCWGCQLPLSSLPCKVKQSLSTWTDLGSTLCLLQASVSSSNNTFPGKNYATGYLFKWLNIVIRIISIAPYCLSNFL